MFGLPIVIFICHMYVTFLREIIVNKYTYIYINSDTINNMIS